jgi:hypothetical protein
MAVPGTQKVNKMALKELLFSAKEVSVRLNLNVRKYCWWLVLGHSKKGNTGIHSPAS